MSVIISLFIFFAAYDIFEEAVAGEGHTLANVGVTVAGAFINILFMYCIARYKITVGKEAQSPALIADGHHSKAHMYANIAILIGILSAGLGLSSMDRIAALVIVSLVFVTGLKILIGAVRALRSGTTMKFKLGKKGEL